MYCGGFVAKAQGTRQGGLRRVQYLGAPTIGPEIDPDVRVPASGGERFVALALKSGNFGASDFFDNALERLAGR